MKRNVLMQVVSMLLIILFSYTAVSKLIDFEKFKLVIRQTNLLKPFSSIIAIMIPALELGISGLLLSGRFSKLGMRLSFVLMMVFTLYAFYLNFFASHRPCACGGVINSFTWRQHLIFNTFFTLVAAAGVWLYNKSLKHESDRMPQIKYI